MLPPLYQFRQLYGGCQRWQNPSIGKIHQTLSAKLEYLAFVDEIPAIGPTPSDESVSLLSVALRLNEPVV